jgi:hypothetical protein
MLKQTRKFLMMLMLLAFGGCATLPTGPSVRVMPTPGKPFDQFMSEDAICRQWAERQIGMNPQEISSQNAVSGAAVGTAIGAGAGALLGAASGKVGAGAAIGAGSGLLIGTASGASSGQIYGEEVQRRYDNAYVQCMYSEGNQVPGIVTQPARRYTPNYPPPDM